ncbi:hypothetical protein [Thalassiella azotivora]
MAVLKLVVKVVSAVLATAISAALALEGAGVWSATRATLVGLVVGAAVLAAGSTSAAAVGEWRAHRLGARRASVDMLLDATLWSVADATGLDYRDLGVAAYAVRRPWWAPWSTRLRRVHRVRARRRPTASNVRWRPGKGVIGECVCRGQVVARDLAADYAAIWPCTREEWETVVTPEMRQGLTWREFLQTRDKYEVVVATPVLDSTGAHTVVRGCVALDGPAGSLDRLFQDDVLGALDTAAQSLLRLRGPG